MKPAAILIVFLLVATFAVRTRAESPAAPAPTSLSMLSFKMNFSAAFTSAVATSGIGVYPINVVRLLDHAALTLSGSVGAAASVVLAANESPDIAAKITGAIVQPRIAVGARYVPVRGMALTTELSYAPCTVEVVKLSAGGNVGSLFGLSVGAEWL